MFLVGVILLSRSMFWGLTPEETSHSQSVLFSSCMLVVFFSFVLFIYLFLKLNFLLRETRGLLLCCVCVCVSFWMIHLLYNIWYVFLSWGRFFFLLLSSNTIIRAAKSPDVLHATSCPRSHQYFRIENFLIIILISFILRILRWEKAQLSIQKYRY